MTWTPQDEAAFTALSKRRESSKEEIGRAVFIKGLRDIADQMEAQKLASSNVEIEYLRRERPYGTQLPEGPVYGMKMTATFMYPQPPIGA